MKSTLGNDRARHALKLAALAGTVALGLLLTSCYIPPDEISGDTEKMTTGSGNQKWQTFAPSEAPTATPTPTPTQQPVIVVTNQGGNGGTIVTQAPSGGSTITVITQAPTSTPTQAPLATATPAAASNSLRSGSTGASVKAVQQRLKDLGYYKGSVDGAFGDGTESAVKAFQSANGLSADGVVGDRTLARLNSSSAKPYSASSSSTSKTTARKTATPTPKPTATPNLTKATYLTIGSSGAKVRTLQNRLIQLGWLGGKADGEYGGATQAAVKAYQKKAGLWADGIAGPDTQASLYSDSAKKSSSLTASIGETLKKGSEGNAVRALQKQLKSLGYYAGTVDGSFGEGTAAAVKAFQSSNGLKADGEAGTATLNKLYSDSAVAADGTSGSGTAAGGNETAGNTYGTWSATTETSSGMSSTGYTALSSGDTGDAVTRLQERLKYLGFYDGNVDGKFGAGTANAVKAYQKKSYLRADGIAGPATQRSLFGIEAQKTYATVREGDTGKSVATLQYTLYELGYYDGTISGVYGGTTSDAVRAFQINNGLKPVDGIAGNITLQRLYSGEAKGVTAPNTNFVTLRAGTQGEEVIEMQEVLKELGYLDSITGSYDSATSAAVKRFQKNNGLDADGVAGAATQQVLYSSAAIANY